MIFRKIGCLVVTSNLVKLKSISSWPKNIAKTTENDLCFHFHFKWLPVLENRREKERKSKKIADVRARRSHRSKTIAPLRSFKPTLDEPSHQSSRSSRHFRTTCEERDRKRKKIDNRTRSTIAPVQRSHQIVDRTSPTPTPLDLAFTARSRIRLHRSNPIASLSSSFSQFDRIWWIFLLGFVSFVSECGIDSFSTCLQLRKCMENWVAWLCKAFSVKMFERTKHRNWFFRKMNSEAAKQPKNIFLLWK